MGFIGGLGFVGGLGFIWPIGFSEDKASRDEGLAGRNVDEPRKGSTEVDEPVGVLCREQRNEVPYNSPIMPFKGLIPPFTTQNQGYRVRQRNK